MHRIQNIITFVVIVAFAHGVAFARAFGPRPRPRLYAKPSLPRRLHDAERALGEFAPGGYAYAGALGDAEETIASARKFEEYALRGERGRQRRDDGGRALGTTTTTTTTTRERARANAAERDEYEGTIDSFDDGERAMVLANDVTRMKATTSSAGSDDDASAADDDRAAARTSTAAAIVGDEAPAPTTMSPSEEMFAMLKREAEAHVNPRTGKPFAWGDTWMHSRGGGVGTGRAESRPRRITAEGVVEVMPAKNGAGLALVPASGDKVGLLEFYDACNGPRWSVQRNWGVGEPCANAWHGVVCFGGRVVELLLNLNNVACMGSLNVTALATHARELRYIDLSDNLFTGDLPKELFNMTQLQSIVLSGNRITGTLSEDIGALVHLRHLDLSANALRGDLPLALGSLSKLEVLHLGESGLENKNSFTGPIPETWRGLKALKHLSLAGNENIRGGVPDWLLNSLHALRELTMSNCGLTGALPENIDQLSSLVTLDLGENHLSGDIPIESLARLSRLKHARLTRNAFSGSLTANVGKLVELETFDVSSNALVGEIPRELFDLPLLEVLDVSNNDFTGPLAPPVAKMKTPGNLRVLLAGNNRLSGTPANAALFERAPFLRTMRVNDNAFDGAFDDDAFEGARELVEFDAANNALTGAMPSSVGAMEKLESISFAKNRRFGGGETIAPELQKCAALKVLDLSGCDFKGNIPGDAFANMGHLSFLRLASNGFTGPIPDSLRKTKYLRELDLHGNAFQGVIPEWLVSELDHLERIDLSMNALSGFIPPTFYDDVAKSVKALPAYNERAAGQKRSVRLAQNPLFCPLPSWATRLVAATCRETRIDSIEPRAGSLAGGTDIVITGSFPAPNVNGVGCLFGTTKSAEVVFVEALHRSDARMTCTTPALHLFAVEPSRSPAGFAVTVNVGFKTSRPGVADEYAPVSKFGELFMYTR